jgi:hypothetical protein
MPSVHASAGQLSTKFAEPGGAPPGAVIVPRAASARIWSASVTARR